MGVRTTSVAMVGVRTTCAVMAGVQETSVEKTSAQKRPGAEQLEARRYPGLEDGTGLEMRNWQALGRRSAAAPKGPCVVAADVEVQARGCGLQISRAKSAVLL